MVLLLYTLPSLRAAVVLVVFCTVWSSAEKQLLCSSEYGSIWYEYEGPVYYFSASLSPCSFGITTLNINYTIISMFTFKLAGYHLTLKYQNKQWFELSEPLKACEGFKICHIIKGETLKDSFSAHLKTHTGAEIPGQYVAHVTVNIIDDFNRELTINATLTIDLLHRPQY